MPSKIIVTGSTGVVSAGGSGSVLLISGGPIVTVMMTNLAAAAANSAVDASASEANSAANTDAAAAKALEAANSADSAAASAVIAASAPVTSVAGKTGDVTFSKSDVGLGNIDNTADAAKPVSAATQTALNAKASLSGDIFTGTVTAPNFVSSSDARFKTEVETIGAALAIVEHLRGVRFTADGCRQIGVIAQETEPHLPEVVFDMGDGIKRVAYGNITGLLIEAIKELSARIVLLEDQIGNVKP
jgi:endosialidase-like protein